MSRWQDMRTTLSHMAMSASQDAGGFKFLAATASSFLLVFLRCMVSSESARQAEGTPQADYAKTAAAQTVFREWGAFLTSYGVVNAVNIGLGKASQGLFNIRPEKVGHLGLGAGLTQLGAVLVGAQKNLPPAPTVLTGETRFHVGPGGIRGKGLLTRLAHAMAKPAQLAGLPADEIAKRGFKTWLDFGPTLVGSAIGVVLSGWMLERLALIKGPQLVAYMMKAPDKHTPSPTADTIARQHPPLQLAQVGPPVFAPGARLAGGAPSALPALPPVRWGMMPTQPSVRV